MRVTGNKSQVRRTLASPRPGDSGETLHPGGPPQLPPTPVSSPLEGRPTKPRWALGWRRRGRLSSPLLPCPPLRPHIRSLAVPAASPDVSSPARWWRGWPSPVAAPLLWSAPDGICDHPGWSRCSLDSLRLPTPRPSPPLPIPLFGFGRPLREAAMEVPGCARRQLLTAARRQVWLRVRPFTTHPPP